MIIIIGVLAAVAIPAYQDYQERAAMADMPDFGMGEMMRASTDHIIAYATYVSAHAAKPLTTGELALPQTHYQFGDIGIDGAEDVDQDIEHRFSGGGFQGEVFWMIASPVTHDEGALTGVEWVCDASGMPQSLVPESCQ